MSTRCANDKFTSTVYGVLVLMLFAASVARASNPVTDSGLTQSPEHRYQSARAAAQAGEIEWAMQEYAKLMLEEPDNVDYLFAYGQALFWSNDARRSIRILERARKLAPDYEDIWKLEYRARVTAMRDPSSESAEQFRRLAASRFPDAVWHRRSKEPASRKYHWEFETSREYLDNGAPDWQQVHALFGRKLTEKAQLTLSASTLSRFDTTDTQFGSGASLNVGENWTVSGGVAVSSSPSFLPEIAVELQSNRRFEHGWVGGVRLRRREYEITSVGSIGILTERYFGKFRIAYSLDSARLSSEQAVVHAMTANFYASTGFQLGVVLAVGEEIEIVGPGQLLRTDVNSMALTGRHPINEYLGLAWRLVTHRQGQLYRRNAIGISIFGGF
jgi:YaiO family outer membrane protein